MRNQENDLRKRPHHQGNDQKQPPHRKQEPNLQELLDQDQEQEQEQEQEQKENQDLEQEQEQEQDQEQEQVQEQTQNHSISNPPAPPHNMNSSPPPKPPPPKPPSPLIDKDSQPDFTHSSDHHTSYGYGYAFSPPQLNQAKYQFPPPDQTSQSYVFSPSPDVKSAKAISPSPSPPPPEAQPSIPVSKTQDEDIVQKPVADGVSGGSRRKPKISISERKKENMMKKALLGFRFLGLVFCLVSFSIMAADKNQGWALDSFYSYKEFRYCMSVNVIGFVYLGLQVYDLATSLATGNHVTGNQLRYFLDFSLDQVLTYLLLSASSSAVFRVEDWESNWGSDKFPAMARSSVILSFLAFVAFALCSLVSGHTLFTPKSI